MSPAARAGDDGQLVQVRDLKKWFPITGGLLQRTVAHVRAVDGVSFSIKKGTTLGLVGESGCGKTTVGRTLLRLTEPTGGSIRFQGQEIGAIPRRKVRALRPEMQIVFQDPMSSLNPRMTVKQILAEPLKENPEVLLESDEERAVLRSHRRRLTAWRVAAVLGFAAALVPLLLPSGSWFAGLVWTLGLLLGMSLASVAFEPRLRKAQPSGLVWSVILLAAGAALLGWLAFKWLTEPSSGAGAAFPLFVGPALVVVALVATLVVFGLLPSARRLLFAMPKRIQRRMDTLLAQVGLREEHVHRFPHEFSGGQRQRIGVARALMLNPDLIVLDEPTSALDVSVQAQVLNLLKKLQKGMDLTYLFISHDLGVVRHLCDEVAVMYLGRIVEQGPVEEVFTNPQHPYTQALIAAVPIPDPERKAQRIILSGDVPSPVNPPVACRFHPRCPRAQALCSQVDPPLEEKKPGQLAACHFPGPQEKWPLTQKAPVQRAD